MTSGKKKNEKKKEKKKKGEKGERGSTSPAFTIPLLENGARRRRRRDQKGGKKKGKGILAPIIFSEFVVPNRRSADGWGKSIRGG